MSGPVDDPSHFRDAGRATGPVRSGPVFEVVADEGRARAGVLRTAHGIVETPGVHARRHEGDRQDAPPGRGARARRADRARQHVPPALPARRRVDRRARRPAPLHGLGRADPHRFGRLPGLLAPRHDRARRRRRRHVPQRLRRRRDALHARAGSAHPGEPGQRHRDVPRPGPAARRLEPGARRRRPPDDRMGRPAGGGAARRRPAALRHHPGRGGRGAAPPFDRGDRRARVRRQRDRRPRDRRGPRGDVRHDRLGDRAPATRPARATSWGSATPRASSR